MIHINGMTHVSPPDIRQRVLGGTDFTVTTTAPTAATATAITVTATNATDAVVNSDETPLEAIKFVLRCALEMTIVTKPVSLRLPLV